MSEAEQTHEMATGATQAVAATGAGVVEVEEELLVEEVSIDGMCGVY
ncbi:mycofactocin precursor MftA [Streptomyces sp. NPDC008313]